MNEKDIARKIWDKFLEFWQGRNEQSMAEVERAIGFARLREQLWDALENSEQAASGWTYPLDIFVADNNQDLFSIVTQNGKLYQVPITIQDEKITLGEWLQVTEVFEPVTQSTFTIKRQKDGTHRWIGVVSTSVINRAGEIDSTTLFDSFIEHWQDTGECPRVDFYHLGGADPEVWEFGTADYLAREGCCYIASGTFDEDHPLAKATIRAYEADPDIWGWSIEFYAMAEPEILVVDPQVQVPVYKRGKNTRISVVKEADAAALFTRLGITEETIRMKRDIEEKLKELFGDDEKALSAFLESVEGVNRTIQDERLIHRSKKRATEDSGPDEGEDDEEDTEGDEEDDTVEDEATELILDDEAVEQIATQVVASESFVAIQQSLKALQETVDKIASAQEENAQEVSRLKKINKKLTERLETVEADETVKKQTWAEDLPRKRAVHASYRPREEHGSADDEDDDSMARIAAENLKNLPSY